MPLASASRSMSKSTFPFNLLLVLLVFSSVVECQYYGVWLGSLRNESHGTSGQVWLVNAGTIQITELSIEIPHKQELSFAFSSQNAVEPVKSLYKIAHSPDGEEILTPTKSRLDMGKQMSPHRLVVFLPSETKLSQWEHFGLTAGKARKHLIVSVPINKHPPEPFCCIRNNEHSEQGIIGEHYNAGTGPIVVEDSRTLLLQKLSLEATRAPDAWVFAGKGEVRQSTGKKAMVVGRDTPSRHCSLREEYNGDKSIRVRLPAGQDVYQLNYLSLFCYQYDVDFGHISFHLDPMKNPVPAYIPPVVANNGQEEPEVLENNDLDGTC